MKQSRSYNGVLLPVLLTVACFVLAWYVVLPNYYEERSKLSTLEEEVLAARAKYNSLEQTKTDLSGVSDILDIIYVAVSPDTDEPNLITELEAIAIKHELTLPSISISDPTAGGAEEYYSDYEANTVGAIQVSFSVAGEFDKLNAFIDSLEKSIKFMNVKSLSYQSSEAGGLVYLSVQLEAYKY